MIWSKVAAATACLSDFTVITGGPGTGKTTTVTKILLLMYALAYVQQQDETERFNVCLAAPTGNIYESVVILYKRANQIAMAEKRELTKKLEEFRNDRDTMEEVFENKEQIEISKYYERQPKPDLVAIAEFENGDLYYRKAQNENPIDISKDE